MILTSLPASGARGYIIRPSAIRNLPERTGIRYGSGLPNLPPTKLWFRSKPYRRILSSLGVRLWPYGTIPSLLRGGRCSRLCRIRLPSLSRFEHRRCKRHSNLDLPLLTHSRVRLVQWPPTKRHSLDWPNPYRRNPIRLRPDDGPPQGVEQHM